MAETYLTPADLAQRTGYSINTLARWRMEGRGPRFIKPGGGRSGHVRYRLSDVLKWEDGATIQNTGEAA